MQDQIKCEVVSEDKTKGKKDYSAIFSLKKSENVSGNLISLPLTFHFFQKQIGFYIQNTFSDYFWCCCFFCFCFFVCLSI